MHELQGPVLIALSKSDWTQEGIARELVLAGVPHEDIVLAFQTPVLRGETEFAPA